MQKFFLSLVILISIPIALWFFTHLNLLVAKPFLTSKAIVTPTTAPTVAQFKTGCAAITIKSPKPYQKISGILEVVVIIDNAKKDCTWTIFEAQAGVAAIEDENGKVLASAPLTTKDDWTANKPLTFTASIPFDNPTGGKNLSLTIQEENPKGDANPQTISIPIEF